MATEQMYNQTIIEEYVITDEPYYLPLADEIEIFEAAYHQRVPVLLKGPTGTGKTRFVEHMAWRLGEELTVANPDAKAGASSNGHPESLPLVTVACHEDLTASDLIGRYLLDRDGTRWQDGPLTRAVKSGRHLLSRRSRRSEERHHGDHPPPDRPPPDVDDRQTGFSNRRRGRFFAGGVVQPRISERGQRPQTQHPPTVCGSRV